MCNPVAFVIGEMAITAVGAYANYSAQKAAASSQAQAIQNFATAQSQNILNSTIANYKQGQQQITYNQAAAGQKMQQEARNVRSAAATSAASAGGAGVDGLSVQALQNDYANRQAEFNTDVAYNEKATDEEIALQMQGFQNQAQSGLNQIQSMRMPSSPSPFVPLMQVAGAGLGAYGKYMLIPDNQSGGVTSVTSDSGGMGYEPPT